MPCRHASQQCRAARLALRCDDGLAYDSCIVHSTSKKRLAAANQTLLLLVPFDNQAHTVLGSQYSCWYWKLAVVRSALQVLLSCCTPTPHLHPAMFMNGAYP